MHTHIDDLSLVLGEIALFRGLPSSAVSDIARSTQVLSLPKGSKVYSAGERPRALYQVMSGHLKVAVCSSEGGEKVIEILSPHQIFGVAELFGEASYVSSVETVSPVVVVAVGRDGIFRAMEHEPCVGRRMLAAVAERQSSIERDIAADCFPVGLGQGCGLPAAPCRQRSRAKQEPHARTRNSQTCAGGPSRLYAGHPGAHCS